MINYKWFYIFKFFNDNLLIKDYYWDMVMNFQPNE